MKPSHCTPYIYTIFVNYTSIKLKKDPRINHGGGGGSFSGGSDCKESVCNIGDPGLIPGSGRSPGERNGNLLPVF